MASEVLTPRSIAGLTPGRVQERSPWLNMMVYALSGWGKTTLAGSASVVDGMAPVLAIDAEGGSESLRHSYPDVEFIRITNWEQSVEVYSDIFDQVSRSVFPYNTIIVDSMNECQKYGMNSIMKKVVKKAEEKGEERDEEVPSKREYLINLEQMRRFTRGYRDLEVHTIFTCLCASYRDEMTGKVNNQPLLTGKFQAEVPALIDEVWYGYKREIGDGDKKKMTRILLTDATDTTVAKSRNGTLPQTILEPTMTDLFKYLTSSGAKKNG